MSEFLRQLIVNSKPFASAAREGTREVTAELDELKREVDRLSQMVKQGRATQSSARAISDDQGPQIVMLEHEAVIDP